jgi:RAB protein geranylgeranyltransferase component A
MWHVDVALVGASLSHCFLAALLSRKYSKSVLLTDSSHTYGSDPSGTPLHWMARPLLAAEGWIDHIKEFEMEDYFVFRQIPGFFFVYDMHQATCPLVRKVIDRMSQPCHPYFSLGST